MPFIYLFFLTEYGRFCREIFIEKFLKRFPNNGILGAVDFIKRWLDSSNDEWPTLNCQSFLDFKKEKDGILWKIIWWKIIWKKYKLVVHISRLWNKKICWINNFSEEFLKLLNYSWLSNSKKIAFCQNLFAKHKYTFNEADEYLSVWFLNTKYNLVVEEAKLYKYFLENLDWNCPTYSFRFWLHNFFRDYRYFWV